MYATLTYEQAERLAVAYTRASVTTAPGPDADRYAAVARELDDEATTLWATLYDCLVECAYCTATTLAERHAASCTCRP